MRSSYKQKGKANYAQSELIDWNVFDTMVPFPFGEYINLRIMLPVTLLNDLEPAVNIILSPLLLCNWHRSDVIHLSRPGSLPRPLRPPTSGVIYWVRIHKKSNEHLDRPTNWSCIVARTTANEEDEEKRKKRYQTTIKHNGYLPVMVNMPTNSPIERPASITSSSESFPASFFRPAHMPTARIKM